MEIQRLGGAIGRFKRKDKDNMLDTETGEIIEINHSKNRSEEIQGIRRSIRNLRMIINANFLGEMNELFLTLTYVENMRDIKKLYEDFKNFMKRLRYKYKDNKFEYIAVPEPQLRGAWHLHILLKAINKQYLYISNDEIAELWRNGFTKTQRLENIDNIGAYLSAYLTDLIDEETGTATKGARLYLYPAGMNLYRCSKGIKKPDIIQGNIGIQEEYKVYEKEFNITRDDEIVNKVVIKQYNKKRPNNIIS